MLVIIHGWSDNAASFVALGERLMAEGVADAVEHVQLGDYISLDDSVTFDDLTEALQVAWGDAELPTAPRSVDVVVHSTGGLVIRHWMTKYFTPAACPIKRLLMLAPANFGSPLAHKGRSFVGRVIKGFKSPRMFETGEKILKGLELASPFAAALAARDLFPSGTGEPWYGPGRILCTVLVGTSGYSGIAAAGNEDGSDGTVRVSTANLNAVRFTLDFATDPKRPQMPPPVASAGMTAFARLPDENHSTIALKDGGPKDPETVNMMVDALQVDDAGFPAWVRTLEDYSRTARLAEAEDSYACGYQNTVVHVSDHLGADVPDFFLELFGKSSANQPDDVLTAMIQNKIVNTVHAYGDNKSHRSLLINTDMLESQVSGKGKALYVSLTAMPEIQKTKSAGYSTIEWNDIGSVRLDPDTTRLLFQPDRTVLIEIVLRRFQEKEVFRFKPLA